MPDAAQQEATLIVRSLGPQIVQIKTHRLKPLPIEAAAAGQVQTIRASYQYDARIEAAPQSEPAIVLTAVGNESAAAWVWDCEIRSQFAATGAADHVVSYRIQNAGSRQIRLTLPETLLRSDVHGIWVNDKPAAARNVPSPPAPAPEWRGERECGGVQVGRRSARRLEVRHAGLADFDPRASRWGPSVACDRRCRTLACRCSRGTGGWNCRRAMPRAATAKIRRPARPPSFSLRRCLLGCLGRSDDQSVFNPLRREDWQSALGWQKAEDRPADPGTEAETAGWSHFSIDLTDGTSTVTVIRRAAIDAAGWLLFLAVVGIGAWGLSGRPFVLAAAGGGAGASRPAAAGGNRGHFFPRPAGRHVLPDAGTGAAAHDRGRRGGRRTAPREMPSTLTGIVPFGVPLLAALMLCGGDSAAAGQPAKAPPATYSVFIPVDAKQQPTHGKYFLPEPFFAELYRRAALQAEKPQGWMIASAVYRAALAEDAAQAGHVVDRLTAEFEIRVFDAAARVRIPCAPRRGQPRTGPGPTRRSRRAARMGTRRQRFAPGDRRAGRVSPGTDAAADGATRRPSLRLRSGDPRVPTARLEFSVPTGGPQVEFPSALGAVRWEEVQSRWTAELGPSDRLAARWQDAAPAGAGAAVDVEQLLWLKIEPGCVLLDVRMKAKAAGGQLRRLLVRADSALELLPSSRSRSCPPCKPRGGDSSRTYEIQWPQPAGSGGNLRPALSLQRRIEPGHLPRAANRRRRRAGPCDDRWPFRSIRLWSIKCPGRDCRKPRPCPSSSTIGAAAMRPPRWPFASTATPRSGT